MTHPYNIVISLGWWCQVASQLQRAGLRLHAFPFDWMFTPGLPTITALIADGFGKFMDGLRDDGPERELSGRIGNTHYDGLRFRHDDPLNSEADRARYTRRIDRLYRAVRSEHRLLFVHTPKLGPVGDDEACEFGRAVRSVNPAVDYTLMNVILDPGADVEEIPTTLPRLRTFKIFAGETWEGSNPHWDRVLSGFPFDLKRIE